MKDNAYRKAGVDIDAGNQLVQRIKNPARKTSRPGMMAGLGGFGGLFDLKQAGYKDPLLVSATDGVGTKLRVAVKAEKHDSIGIDLVAMCVNDLMTLGAEPLFFLDYYGCGRLDVDVAANVIAGIAEGCAAAGCGLIGGETAEMPGMYQGDDYDLAGFAVGAVEREAVITGETVQAGDVVLGLASSGLHSNGYSLVRKIVTETLKGDYTAPAPFAPDTTIGEALLVPTKIYVRSILKALGSVDIKAMAHITGGGLMENIPRVLPSSLGVVLDAEQWGFLPVFSWLMQAGDLSVDDMTRTFNCGIGMVLICAADKATKLEKILKAAGETVSVIGHVDGGEGVRINNQDTAWRGTC